MTAHQIASILESAVVDMASGDICTAEEFYEDPDILEGLIANQVDLQDPVTQDIILELWEIEDGARKIAAANLLTDIYGFNPNEI